MRAATRSKSLFVVLLIIILAAVLVVSPFTASALGSTPTLELVSKNTSGVFPNGHSIEPSVSSDGRYVAFSSGASDLIANDTDNALPNAYVRDRVTGTNKLVSVTATGGQAYAIRPVISGNGQYVLYCSTNSSIVPNDTNSIGDLFLVNVSTLATVRVNVATDGTQANGNVGFSSQQCNENNQWDLSADGRYVAFDSQATNHVSGVGNGNPMVYVRDTVLNTTTHVNTSPFNSGRAIMPAISDDGRYIAYRTTYSGADQIVIYDRTTGVNKLVTKTDSGVPGNGDSGHVALSADGAIIAFFSSSTNLAAADTQNDQDIYAYSMSLDKVFLVANAPNGAFGTDVDPTGRFVTFSTQGNAFGSGDNETEQVFRADLTQSVIQKVSVKTDGSESAYVSSSCGIFPLPRCPFVANRGPAKVLATGEVIFESTANNLSSLSNTQSPGTTNIFASYVVPEGTPSDPPTAVSEIINTVEDFNLANGISNTLDAKLDAALALLNDVNTNNDVAAVNNLNAFINAVKAQRGKAITEAQADELINAALSVITLLENQ